MWSSKSFGSKLKYGFFICLIKLRLITLARLLIFPISTWYAIRPSVRARCRYYLNRRFPSSTPTRYFMHTLKLYHNFANILFDRILIGHGMKLPVQHDEYTMELLEDALGKGKGCVLVSSHFGSWQNGLMGLERLGKPVAIVLWQEEGVELPYFQYDKAIKVINACGGLKTAVEIRNVLRENGIVCMMGDRMTLADKTSRKVRFLGGSITVPTAPYAIAEMTGAAVVHAASVRSAGGGIRGVRGLENTCEWGEAPQVFADWLSSLVEKYPYDFFNFYDMWINDDKR